MPETHRAIPLSLATPVLVLILAGAVFAYFVMHANMSSTRTALATETSAVAQLQEQLAATQAQKDELSSILQTLTAENQEFAHRVEELGNTVSYLDKLSKTDRELLQKYSSAYFLSENYAPDPIGPISDELLARQGSNLFIHAKVFPFLESMMRAARADNNPLYVVSAYRSFGTQSALKASYKLTYGAGSANQFSADQGYSEHQLGSTVDFTDETNGDLAIAFRTTQQYHWLIAHAHEYGFALSYPEGNTYFQFEPWHWRFVGVDLATRLYNENKYFYDLDQREINSYLARIFD